MENFIEKIALYADIDARRALGFAPRKLSVPKLNLNFPEQELIADDETYIQIPLVVKWTRSIPSGSPDIEMTYRIYDNGKTVFRMITTVWNSEDEDDNECYGSMYYAYCYDNNKSVEEYM
jgi:hypothetical protein